MKTIIFYLTALAGGLFLLFSLAFPAAGMQPTVKPAAADSTYYTWECWDDGTLDACHHVLSSISMVSASDGWAVGNGLVLRWDGTHWNQVQVPAFGSALVNGVFMRSADDGWMTATNNLWRWNGSDWNSVPLPLGATSLSRIQPLAADNAWALYGGSIYHWDGGSWSLFQTVGGLNDIAMVSATDGWAVGTGGKMLRWNGGSWNTYAGPVTYDLNFVSMASATKGWAADMNGDNLQWNGSHWTAKGKVSCGGSMLGLAVSGSNAYAMCISSVALWNGSSWVTSYDRTGEYAFLFYGIGITPGTDGSDVWVVGKDTGIWRGQNGAWTPINDATGRSYTALAFTNPYSGWAFGSRILMASSVPVNHWNGITWTPAGATNGINAVDITPGTNGQDGWAVGYKTAFHWNGSTWNPVDLPFTDQLGALDLLAPGEGWGVGGWGTNGIIARLHGGAWSVFSKPAYALKGVSMVSASDGWAVGAGGMILRWNGLAWNSFASPTTNDLNAVVMLSATEGWAGGNNVLLSWDSSGSWQKVTLMHDVTIGSMAFSSSHNGWASGWGRILHYDNSGWTFVDAPFSSFYTIAFAFATYRDVWGLTYGAILHYQTPPPAITANHTLGAPDSFFHIAGQNFPPDGMAAVTVNGHNLGSVSTGDDGVVAFNLDATGAAEGLYLVTVQAGEGIADLQITLQAGQPQHPKEGSEVTFPVLPAAAYHFQNFVPVIARH